MAKNARYRLECPSTSRSRCMRRTIAREGRRKATGEEAPLQSCNAVSVGRPAGGARSACLGNERRRAARPMARRAVPVVTICQRPPAATRTANPSTASHLCTERPIVSAGTERGFGRRKRRLWPPQKLWLQFRSAIEHARSTLPSCSPTPSLPTRCSRSPRAIRQVTERVALLRAAYAVFDHARELSGSRRLPETVPLDVLPTVTMLKGAAGVDALAAVVQRLAGPHEMRGQPTREGFLSAALATQVVAAAPGLASASSAARCTGTRAPPTAPCRSRRWRAPACGAAPRGRSSPTTPAASRASTASTGRGSPCSGAPSPRGTAGTARTWC